MLKWILIGIGIIILCYIIKCVLAALISTRCPNCKKYNALEFVKEEVVKEENCTILEKYDTKNNKGEVISTSTRRVNGKRAYIKKTYQCKYCKEYHYENSTQETII